MSKIVQVSGTTVIVSDSVEANGVSPYMRTVIAAADAATAQQLLGLSSGGDAFPAQNANVVFAGPTSGSAALPSFRALVAADIPSLDASKIGTGLLAPVRGGTGVDASTAANGSLLIGSGSGFALGTLTAGANITITNTPGGISIAAAGGSGSGSVTFVGLAMPAEFAVGGSPITSSGTLTVSKATQAANTVYAGPSSGSAAQPAFRALVAADIPSLDASKITSGLLAASRGGTGLDASTAANGSLLIGNGAGFTIGTLTAGSNVTITNASGTITIAASGGGGGGTVTSVALSLPADLTVSGSPVTTAGTLSATWASQAANLVHASPSGSSGAPTWRALGAADIPNLNASKITAGTLVVARGGTGVDASTAANGTLLIGTGTGLALATITAGSGVTVTNGSGTITIAATGLGGTVTSVALTMPADFSVAGSPITGSGTLAVTRATQAANLVLAGPTSGAAGTPAYRALVAADIPSLDTGKIGTGQLAVARGGTGVDASTAANGTLLIGNASGFTLTTLTAGSGVTVTNGAGSITIAATGLGGTVTSVALSAPAEFTVSGSPVTGSGTLTFTKATQAANLVYAGPTTGSVAAPTFRALVAADIPSLDTSILTSGQLPIARGGTGNGSFTSHAGISYTTAGSGNFVSSGVYLGTGTGSGSQVLLGLGTDVTSSVRIGFWADTTASAEQLNSTVGGNTGLSQAVRASAVATVLPGALQLARTTFSDAATTITAAHCLVAQTGTLSASRVVTMPGASAVGAGGLVVVLDESGTITATNTLVPTRAGSDTLNGATTFTMTKAYGVTMWVSDGTSKFTLLNPDPLPTLVASKWLTNDGTTASWSSITTGDVSGLGGMATQNASAVAITGGAIDGTPIGSTTRSTGKFTTVDVAQGTIAVNTTNALNVTATWNQGSTVFSAVVVNVTNTASSTSSKLLDLQIAGSSEAFIDRTGSMTLAGNLSVTAGTASVAGLTQAITNTAVSGAFTSFTNCTTTVNPAGSSSAQLIGAKCQAKTASGCAQNLTDTASALTGVYAGVVHAGTGTVTSACGIYVTSSTSNSSGTITTLYGVRISDATKSGGTTITTQYAVYVDAQAAGSTNYSIFTNAGLVNLGGNTTVVGSITVNTGNDPTLLSNVPTWIKFTVTYSQLSTAATTNNIELFVLPAGALIHAVRIKHTTAFSGSSISAYTVSVGIAGTLAKYAAAFDVFQAVGNTAYQDTFTNGSENFGATTSIKIAATSTGANLSAATAGSVSVWVLASKAT